MRRGILKIRIGRWWMTDEQAALVNVLTMIGSAVEGKQ